MQFAFIAFSAEDYQNISKLSYRPLTFTSYKAILNNKKRSRTSLPVSFSAWCMIFEEIALLLYSIT